MRRTHVIQNARNPHLNCNSPDPTSPCGWTDGNKRIFCPSPCGNRLTKQSEAAGGNHTKKHKPTPTQPQGRKKPNAKPFCATTQWPTTHAEGQKTISGYPALHHGDIAILKYQEQQNKTTPKNATRRQRNHRAPRNLTHNPSAQLHIETQLGENTGDIAQKSNKPETNAPFGPLQTKFDDPLGNTAKKPSYRGN